MWFEVLYVFYYVTFPMSSSSRQLFTLWKLQDFIKKYYGYMFFRSKENQ